jgi:hypothetical protein
MPGVIDPKSGTAITSYFLNWDQFPIRDVLERELTQTLKEVIHGSQ